MTVNANILLSPQHTVDWFDDGCGQLAHLAGIPISLGMPIRILFTAAHANKGLAFERPRKTDPVSARLAAMSQSTLMEAWGRRQFETQHCGLPDGRLLITFRPVADLASLLSGAVADGAGVPDLLDALPTRILVISPEDVVTSANAAYRQSLPSSLRDTDPVGRPFHSWLAQIHKEQQRHAASAQEVANQQAAARIRLEKHRTDFRPFDELDARGNWITTTQYIAADGTVTLSSVDRSAEVEAQQAVTAASSLQNTILESAPFAIAIVAPADPHRVLYANVPFQALLGAPASAEAGPSTILELWPDLANRLKRAPRTLKNLEMRSPAFPDVWAQVSTARLPQATLILAADITRAKRAESQHRDVHRHFQTILSLADDALFDFNIDDGQLRISPQAFRLLSKSTPKERDATGAWVIGRFDLLSSALDSASAQQLAASLHAAVTAYRASQPTAFTLTCKAGSTWLHIRAGIQRDGDHLHLLGTISDKTTEFRQQRDLEEALAKETQAREAQSRFLSMISHEIRSPLSFAQISLEMLTQRLSGDIGNQAIAALANVKQAFDLWQTLLDLQTMRHGSWKIDPIPVDLATVLESVLDGLELKATEKRLTLTRAIKLDAPKVVADPTRFRQICGNLVGNAIKFTERGRVQLAATQQIDGDRVLTTITVSDTGPGIPAEKIASLFQPFEQLDRSTSRKHGGAGLGLAIAKGIAELMGGDISVESRVGAGASFTVRLPFPIAPDQAIEPQRSTLSRPANVLLVDDNEHARQLIGMQLQTLDVPFRTASDARQALQLLGLFKDISVVLTDLHMPEMSGWDLAREIRNSQLAIKPRVIALSADMFANDADSFLDERLSKPVSLERLARALNLDRRLPSRAPTPADPGLLDRRALQANLMQPHIIQKALEGFATGTQPIMQDLAAAMDRDDPGACRQALHVLRGAAGYIASPPLLAAIDHLAEACRNGHPDPGLHEKLQRTYQAVLDYIAKSDLLNPTTEATEKIP